MVRGLNALAVSRLTDNPNSAARRNWRARWESNPRLPDASGCSIAVELREYPRDRADGWRRENVWPCRGRVVRAVSAVGIGGPLRPSVLDWLECADRFR